jgi:predicted transcriptional regulator
VTAQRERIRRHVAAHPGVHFSALVRALGLAPGQVQHHVRHLVRADAVVEEPLYGRTHYYEPAYDPWERGAIAVLRRETARDVLVLLLTDGPAGPATVADDLDLARSTVEWHLGHLEEQGLVRKERDARGRVTLVVERPAETTRLLRLVEPSAPDRLVDRFARLFDGFLAGEGGSAEE